MPAIELVYISVCFIVGLSGNPLDDVATDNGIYVLTKSNFDSVINSQEVALVEFYAPWCGHCKQFAPIYSQAAELLKSSNSPIPLCKVDATVETELANRFEISGYPILKVFKSGIPYEYDGERSAQSIVNFLKKVSSPDWEPPKSSVLTLTKENFTEIIESSGYILVEFFAPWCGHCKSLAPEYAKAAKILSKESPPIMLAAVDATAETELAREYNVTGYPTLKLFRNKKVVDYNGPRYSDGIVEWMIKNRENAAVRVESISHLKRVRDPQKPLLLGLFSNEDDLLFSTFIDATNFVRDDFLSAYSFSSDVRNLYNANTNDNIGNIVLLRPEYLSNEYEPHFSTYQYESSNETVDNLVSFFEKNLFPIVAEYNFNTAQFLDRFNKDYLCLFFFTVDFSIHHRAATRKWLEKITKIAVAYKDKIQFAIADDESQSDKLRELRLDDSGEEMNVGCFKRGNIKYRMKPMEEFDKEHILNFIDKLLSDKLFPLLKSAPIPKPSVVSGITTIVGDTYKNLINDVAKDALILVHRSLCEKCKTTRNILSALSAKYSGKILGFFSIDLSQNDLPPIEGLENVDSQPSIYLITDKIDVDSNAILKKRMIKFTGDHSNESDIRSFIIKHSKIAKDEL